MQFEFATAVRIVFGPGKLEEAAPAAASFGKRPLLVVDSLQRAEPLIERLKAAGLDPVPFGVEGEPTIATVSAASQAARAAACDLVIGFGGGSALDTAKAAAGLAVNPGDLFDYLEVVGAGRPLERPGLPFIAIPTTAGTGSEVTRNAVMTVPERRVKVSLRSPFLLARLAILDPLLTLSLPPALTAATGMDALTQCLEPYVCNAPNPLIAPLCLDGIRRAARALPRAVEDGSDAAARQEMCLVSLFGGLALANARLGAAHGLAGPIGGMFPAPHGAVCARLLPEVTAVNLRALQSRQPESPALGRYAEIAHGVLEFPCLEDVSVGFQGVCEWLRALIEKLDIPPLRHYGLSPADFPSIVAQAQKASSMKGNPIPLTDEELTEILQRAL
ncbi:MAG: iron-containing alcohol dehydrogenase [Anaerolineales bacterium]